MGADRSLVIGVMLTSVRRCVGDEENDRHALTLARLDGGIDIGMERGPDDAN